MTASAIDMREYIHSFFMSVMDQLAEIHPSAQCICREHISNMHRAADVGDVDAVTHLLKLTQDKLADELEWEEDKRRSAADPHYVPRCMRHA